MDHFNIIDLGVSNKWNNIVSSFRQYDVYYLSNYVKAFKIHGDGEPLLLSYETDNLRGINVVMKRDISQFAPLNSFLRPETYFDIVTPYGYGGFIFEGDTSESAMEHFHLQYLEFLKYNHVVSEFVRYHPQLKNANVMRSVSTISDLGQTISMDLESVDVIWDNLTSKNRNMIRKAHKSGIEIHHGKSPELMSDFIRIYNETMDKDEANPYYYFGKEFYESIYADLNDFHEMFYAVIDSKIIAISIILFTNIQMHYHLSGSLFEYRNLAPSNLLLFEAACWGNKQGFKTFHLGGGIGSKEDNLFKFKQAFNRSSKNQFSTGKLIVNDEIYNSLVETRKQYDLFFNVNKNYFPLYRAL